ncbi:MAG TPA: bifunctional 2-polyprenyl-6-hydroxyphenol methylase/3-demethylubiquinol 3-O-methyltransferase UbiG [Magnetospirillaceae bacterium]|jgi:2-polyprenyl-6-hydroxyphenyl methylase/3-demethylubiquinone-9 3-methyltransferase
MAATGTAEPEEIARFERLAATWWDETGPMRPLHQLNPPRLEFLRDHLAAHFGRDPKATKPFAGLTLLDVGCGAGLLCEPMTRLGFAVTGIDAAANNIEVAQRHAETMGLAIDYRNAMPEDLSGQFDAVLAMEVVEHVADVPAFMTAMAGLTKPGAAFFASTLNRTAKAFAMAVVGAEYVMRWLPRGTHDWRKFLRPSELAAAMRAVGLDPIAFEGLRFEPMQDRWRRDRSLDVNYMVYGTRR